MIISQDLLLERVHEILKHIPYRPFLCLPLSAMLYADLKDNYGVESQLVTGNLKYCSGYIFKQDFKIIDAEKDIFRLWSGHCWVEIENVICDLSLFRTLYSKEFTKNSKDDLIQLFGTGRGCLLGTRENLLNMGLFYEKMDNLTDEIATQILAGFKQLISPKE